MTLFSPDDTWPLFSIMVAGTAFSLWLEKRHSWAEKLSAPVVALLLAMLLSNTRVIPMEAPAYDFVGTWLVPVALPLLLFRADFMRIARSTGKMMISFHIASVGTMLGAVIAFGLFRQQVLEPENAAGIMTGSYIGGMVNFVAISESTRAAGSLISALIVADNLVMASVFLVLLWIAGNGFFQRHYPSNVLVKAGAAATHSPTAAEHKDVTVMDIAISLAVAVGVAGVAMFAKKHLDSAFAPAAGDDWYVLMGKTLLTNRFVLITGLSLVVSTLFARSMSKINGPEQLGGFLLYLFLFTVGLPADLKTVLVNSPVLFAFCGIMAFTNLVFTLVVGKLCRQPLEDLLLSVNATIGGPPTAAAMAMSKGWHRLVLPGLLIGLWGYIIGTPLGLLITSLCK